MPTHPLHHFGRDLLVRLAVARVAELADEHEQRLFATPELLGQFPNPQGLLRAGRRYQLVEGLRQRPSVGTGKFRQF